MNTRGQIFAELLPAKETVDCGENGLQISANGRTELLRLAQLKVGEHGGSKRSADGSLIPGADGCRIIA